MAWPLGDGFPTITTVVTLLSVQLTAFTTTAASPGAMRLAWAMASQKNSARFERSRDGAALTRIGDVAAAGSSSAARPYAYLDAAAPAGRLYYRLRQVDLDGSATYSPVRTVAFAEATGERLALVPNPAHARLVATGLVAGD